MTCALLAVLAAAQEATHEAVTEHGVETAHAAAGAVEHAGGEHGPGDVLMHHILDGQFWGLPSKHLVFVVIAALLVVLIARIATRSYRKGMPSSFGHLIETFVVFIRDEIAEKNIGHGSAQFVPLLCSFFFFILTAALIGLVPVPNREPDGTYSLGGITATGNLSVTMGLAFVSLVAQQYAGISRYGLVHHLKNLVPPGIPAFLLPIIIPVEIVSVFTKPIALMIRLFANMLAGHLIITSLLLLIPLSAAVSNLMGILAIPVSVGLSLFILLLEILVAFIQAYIFTLLTAIFIGMYAHPAH
jgi:F-type H+-transporting ATPase subunit a